MKAIGLLSMRVKSELRGSLSGKQAPVLMETNREASRQCVFHAFLTAVSCTHVSHMCSWCARAHTCTWDHGNNVSLDEAHASLVAAIFPSPLGPCPADKTSQERERLASVIFTPFAQSVCECANDSRSARFDTTFGRWWLGAIFSSLEESENEGRTKAWFVFRSTRERTCAHDFGVGERRPWHVGLSGIFRPVEIDASRNNFDTLVSEIRRVNIYLYTPSKISRRTDVSKYHFRSFIWLNAREFVPSSRYDRKKSSIALYNWILELLNVEFDDLFFAPLYILFDEEFIPRIWWAM